jgi:hypothetical protein
MPKLPGTDGRARRPVTNGLSTLRHAAARRARPARDRRRAPRACSFVDQALVRRLGGADAVGRRRSANAAFADSTGRPFEMEIARVVGDVRDGGPGAASRSRRCAPMAQVSDEPRDEWSGRELLLVARPPGRSAGRR